MYTAKSSRIFWYSTGLSAILWFAYKVPAEDRANSDWWSLQPVKRSKLPSIKDSKWVRNPIDAFVLAKLESKGLKPSPETVRHTLIRRLSYALTGLPPSPKEVRAFVEDKAPNAYEKVVDRMLASPHYGERWARHWLDVEHFGESHVFE